MPPPTTAESVFYRTVNRDDCPGLLELWKTLPGIGLSTADSEEHIGSFLERNPGMSYLAEDNGRIIGSVLTGHDGRRGYLYHLAVHPDYRRRGMGTRLAELSVTVLKQSGIQKCHIFVYKDNKSGADFWQTARWQLRQDIVLLSREL
ncbi:MAG: GNAT family N-acetyltransferase [Spirochaetia bacterium]